MQPRDAARARLRDRARRLRWVLGGAAMAAFGALVGLVLTNPIGTQAQAAQPADPAQQPDHQPQRQAALPPVSNADQQPPILRTRRS